MADTIQHENDNFRDFRLPGVLRFRVAAICGIAESGGEAGCRGGEQVSWEDSATLSKRVQVGDLIRGGRSESVVIDERNVWRAPEYRVLEIIREADCYNVCRVEATGQ